MLSNDIFVYTAQCFAEIAKTYHIKCLLVVWYHEPKHIIGFCRTELKQSFWQVNRPKDAPISLVVQTFEHTRFLNIQQNAAKTFQPWMWPKDQKAHVCAGAFRMTGFQFVWVSTSHNHCVKGKWLVLMLQGKIPKTNYIQINFHVALGTFRNLCLLQHSPKIVCNHARDKHQQIWVNNMVNRVCKQAIVSGYIAKIEYVKVISLQFHAFRWITRSHKGQFTMSSS